MLSNKHDGHPKMQQWIMTAGFDNKEKAHKSIDHLVKFAGTLKFNTMAEFKAQSFEDLVTLAGSANKAYKDIRSVYDADVDAIPRQRQSNKHRCRRHPKTSATCSLEMTMFDTPLSFEFEMVER